MRYYTGEVDLSESGIAKAKETLRQAGYHAIHHTRLQWIQASSRVECAPGQDPGVVRDREIAKNARALVDFARKWMLFDEGYDPSMDELLFMARLLVVDRTGEGWDVRPHLERR